MNAKTTKIVYWTTTALFGAAMGFSAFAYLTQAEMQQAFTHLGFPQYFRVELAVFKILGVLALLIPIVPARLKEWAYAGFFINLVSAFIAHTATGDAPMAYAPFVAGISAIYLASYVTFRQIQGVK